MVPGMQSWGWQPSQVCPLIRSHVNAKASIGWPWRCFAQISDLASCLFLSLHDNYFSAQVIHNQFLLFAKRIMTAEISTYSLSINIIFLSPSNQSLSGKAQLSHKAFIITPLRNVPWGPMTATVSIVKSCSMNCAGGIFMVNLLLIKTLKDWHFDN